MYCPVCAQQNEKGSRFCRSCGQDLTLVSQALAGSGPVMLAGQISKELKEYKHLRKQPSVTRAMYWSVIGAFLAVFWVALFLLYPGHMGLGQLPVLLISLLFLAMGAKEFVKYKRSLSLGEPTDDELPQADRLRSERRLDLGPGDLSDQVSHSVPGKALQGTPAAAPSVTESTTRNLDVTREEEK